jgi:hypothetical protein
MVEDTWRVARSMTDTLPAPSFATNARGGA